MEKVFSNRLKGFHIINYPPYVDVLLNMSKRILSPKLMSRVSVDLYISTNIQVTHLHLGYYKR
ncbi:hypothetical protein NQ314_021046 [Rhamnusium bicolor]|uniref:CRAL-TRIO domain-containing protein n=1 Tax=Rhamnusium bicolor TaxID=1586634 RepID=A0AAV8WIF8_9CUCU|nr:hypothetical protein NQ314_021046 [Rhamnusium bicolor]